MKRVIAALRACFVGCMIICGTAVVVATPAQATAYSAGSTAGGATVVNGLPYATALSQIKADLSGPTAGILAVLAFVGCGAALVWGGEISGFVKSLIYTAMAASLMVSADALVTNFFSSASVF